MRVRLIQESSGFGYNSKVVSWLAKDSENYATVLALAEGQIRDIPENVARNCHNLVDTATGKIISKSYSITIPEAQLEKYIDKTTTEIKSIGADIKKIKAENKKLNSNIFTFNEGEIS
jgi:uncharacterized protein (UPF0335 family)